MYYMQQSLLILYINHRAYKTWLQSASAQAARSNSKVAPEAPLPNGTVTNQSPVFSDPCLTARGVPRPASQYYRSAPTWGAEREPGASLYTMNAPYRSLSHIKRRAATQRSPRRRRCQT